MLKGSMSYQSLMARREAVAGVSLITTHGGGEGHSQRLSRSIVLQGCIHHYYMVNRRQQRNLVANWVPSSTANPTWQSSCSFKAKQGGKDCSDRLHDFPTSTGEMVNAPSSIVVTDPRAIEGLGTSAFYPGLDGAPDFGCALSLLSTDNDNTLGLNNSETNSSVEMQLMQVNQSSSGSSSSGGGAVQVEASMVHYSLKNFLNDMINNFSIIPLQEFQLLSEPSCLQLLFQSDH
ncbi:hypothetical protein FEM48_Zijuj05G0004700 [Ziziphus jujuba var. spinosa]|uniref:Uncharacterized protein n=1 Tax=Ziziphus jujuba var. spinosa TaxID=714518 RepID=A0A978VBR0_ZIZJJ|nr:hypothetical protein FEM48_Zijuj05G0004700 [Ziziphus jujuba var. spinosa]